MADPIDTGKKTVTGRTIWRDPETGEDYSERSTTFKIDNKYYTMPTVAEDGSQYTEDQIKDYVKEHGPFDYLTGEELPEFRYREDALQYAVSRSDTRKQKEEPMLQEQMELFNEGGLKDEGGMIDEASGNEVPVGGTRKGVRDDIPVNVSEGEFIFPEDVTRYIGLDKLMQLRQEAKMGLKRMEAMGQMGNSDEATMEDDLPFGMADLIIVDGMPEDEEELDMAVGGVTMQPNQVRRLNTAPISSTPVVSAPTTTPLSSDSVGVRRLTPDRTGEGAIQRTLSFKELMGDAYLEMFEYRNEAGEVLMVPHLNGAPVYEVPPGYTIYNPATDVDESGTGSAVAADEDAAPIIAQIANENSDRDPPATQPPAPIDWDNLSTEDFMKEAAGLTGMSRTIASGITLFMGPLGFLANSMMKHQDKKVIAEIDARLAAGGLTSAEVSELKKIRASLEKTSGGIFGKILDTLGGIFGKGKEEVEAAKAQAEKIDSVVTTTVQQETTDPLVQTAVDTAKSGSVDQTRDALLSADITEEQRKDLVDVAYTPIVEQDQSRSIDTVDTLREAVSQLTPVGKTPVTAPDRTFRDMTQTAPNFGEASVLPKAEPVVDTLPKLLDQKGETPTKTPEEVVMSQPVVAAAPVTPVSDALNQQTEDAFQPTVVQTTGTGTGRDFADMPVTGEQIAYASAAESREQPYDPRNITTVPSEQTTNIPVTAQVQTDIGSMSPPTVQQESNIATPVSDTFNRPAQPSTLAPSAVSLSKPDVYSSTVGGTGAVTLADPLDAFGGVGPEIKQTQEVFGEDYTPTSAELNAQLAEQGKVNLTTTPTESATDTSTLTGITAASKTPTLDITASEPAAKQTFSEAFAANRAAGKDTFTYGGKSYTTQTKEEAAPSTTTSASGENTLFQTVANALTPTDGKEYVGGVLKETTTTPAKTSSVDTGVATVAKTTSEGKTVIPTGVAITSGTKLNSKDDPVVIVNNKAMNKSKADETKTTSSSKTTTTSSTKDVQTQINEKIKNATDSNGNVDWNKADVGDLVKQREAAKTTTTTTKSDNKSESKSDDGGGWSYGCYVATALNSAGYWSHTKKLKLIKWCIETKPENKLSTKLWRNGYVVFGKKVIAPKVHNKIIQWLSNGFYCATVQKKTNLQAILGKLFFYVPSYSIGIWKALCGNLVDIKRT